MKISLIVGREVNLQAAINGSPYAVLGPMSVAIMNAIESQLNGLSPSQASTVYAQIAAAGGLVKGVGLPSTVNPFAGINIVGPQGLIPFVIDRAYHRVGAGSWISSDASSVRVMDVSRDPAWMPSFALPADNDGLPIYLNRLQPSTQTENRILDDGLLAIAREDNSFVTPNGDFSNLPGYSQKLRVYSRAGHLVPEMSTLSEVTGSNPNFGLATCARRTLGFGINILTDNGLNTAYGAKANQVNNKCILYSQYDIIIDDQLITAAGSLSGDIYAVVREIDASNPLFAFTRSITAHQYSNYSCMSVGSGGLCNVSYMSLTRSGSGWNTTSTREEIDLRDEGGAAVTLNDQEITLMLGAGVNIANNPYQSILDE